LRIVLDTNVVLSALLWRGTPHLLLDAIRRRSDIELCASPALLAELADVLRRPAAARRLAIIGKDAREILADYLEAVRLADPADVPRVVPGDPDDDHVLAAAVAARATLIVSGDGDLVSLRRHRDIEIVPVTDALRLLTAPDTA
jgi:putative PIN family toxin of toxin-antitoxin system